MCPRVASIGKCRAPRVNDDTLSARHCTTEFIYSIYPGTKVCGSSAGHRSLQWPASCSKPAASASLTRASSRRYGTGLRRFAPFSVASPRQDYVAGAPFSFSLPRVILRENAKVRPAVAELLFSHVPLPYESKLSTVEYHTKKAQPDGCAFAFFRDPDRIRTCDPQLRRLLLYPAELPDQSN